MSFDGLAENLKALLDDIQESLLNKAMSFRKENTHVVDDYETFKKELNKKGGFFLAHWDGTAETEQKIKEETQATIRCIPFDQEKEEGVCMYSGKPSKGRVVFAKAY